MGLAELGQVKSLPQSIAVGVAGRKSLNCLWLPVSSQGRASVRRKKPPHHAAKC